MGNGYGNLHPLQLGRRGDALQCEVSSLQDKIARHVLGEVELGSRNRRERLLHDLPHDLSNRFRSVEGTVKVPTSKVELLCNLIKFLVGKRVFRRCVRRTSALLAVSPTVPMPRLWSTYHYSCIHEDTSHSRHILKNH